MCHIRTFNLDAAIASSVEVMDFNGRKWREESSRRPLYANRGLSWTSMGVSAICGDGLARAGRYSGTLVSKCPAEPQWCRRARGGVGDAHVQLMRRPQDAGGG